MTAGERDAVVGTLHAVLLPGGIPNTTQHFVSSINNTYIHIYNVRTCMKHDSMFTAVNDIIVLLMCVLK